MNYFSHGFSWLDDPYFLVGTALPDMLCVAERRAKLRTPRVSPFAEHSDARLASMARGILRHLHDDGWFHQTRAFAEVSLDLTVQCRDALAPDDGMRPSFLGHILLELLLDATLMEDRPGLIDRYYEVLRQVDFPLVQQAVDEWATRPAPRLSEMLAGFLSIRFLPDYLEDDKLLFRLNQVMRRVGLPALPERICEVFTPARRQVRARRDELLAGLS